MARHKNQGGAQQKYDGRDGGVLVVRLAPPPSTRGLFFAGSQVHQPMAVRLSPEKADCQFKPLALLAPHLPTRKQKRVRGHGMFGVFLECVVCVECLNEGANSTD